MLLALENQLCFALVTAARNVVAVYRPILEPLGLTHPQYLVMLALWEQSPRSLGELADELALEPATLSPLVKRLEAQGRVARSRRAGDERVLDISLTDEGRALRARALDVPRQVMARTGMDAAELVALRDALSSFAGRRVATVPHNAWSDDLSFTLSSAAGFSTHTLAKVVRRVRAPAQPSSSAPHPGRCLHAIQITPRSYPARRRIADRSRLHRARTVRGASSPRPLRRAPLGRTPAQAGRPGRHQPRHGQRLPRPHRAERHGGRHRGACPRPVNSTARENPNTVFAAAGDMIGASTFTSFIQEDDPTIEALNAAGLDVSAVGQPRVRRGLRGPHRPRHDPMRRVGVPRRERLREGHHDPALPEYWITEFDGVHGRLRRCRHGGASVPRQPGGHRRHQRRQPRRGREPRRRPAQRRPRRQRRGRHRRHARARGRRDHRRRVGHRHEHPLRPDRQ